MEIRKQRLWTWRDSWAWGLVLGLFTALGGIAVVAGGGTPARWIALATLAAAWSIAARRYWLRWQAIKGIAWYTSQGVAVTLASASVRGRMTPGLRAAIDTAIEATIEFWGYRYQEQAERIRGSFNGGWLTVTDQPIMVKFRGRVAGAAFLNHFAVYWPTGDYGSNLISLIRHEGAHVAMFAAGVVWDEERQHALMEEAGWT